MYCNCTAFTTNAVQVVKRYENNSHNLQPLQTFVEFARCERVMTTRAEFHFSWVYTFSAMLSFLRIWASDSPRETGCDPALPAQLCRSSSSSFPQAIRFDVICLAVHLIPQSRGNDSITFRFFRCPGVFSIAVVSFSSLKFLIFVKYTQLFENTYGRQLWLV